MCVRVGGSSAFNGSAVHAFKACAAIVPHSHGQHGLRPTPRPPAAGLPRRRFNFCSRGEATAARCGAELFRLRSSLVHHISCDECGCVCTCVSRSRRRRSQREGQQNEAPCCPHHHALRVGSVGRRVRTLVAPMGHTQSSCHLSPNSKYSEYSFTTLLI